MFSGRDRGVLKINTIYCVHFLWYIGLTPYWRCTIVHSTTVIVVAQWKSTARGPTENAAGGRANNMLRHAQNINTQYNLYAM
jgi:hypothetical protein